MRTDNQNIGFLHVEGTNIPFSPAFSCHALSDGEAELRICKSPYLKPLTGKQWPTCTPQPGSSTRLLLI